MHGRVVSADHSPLGIFQQIWELGSAGARGVAPGLWNQLFYSPSAFAFSSLVSRLPRRKRKSSQPLFLWSQAPVCAWPQEKGRSSVGCPGACCPLCPHSHSSFPECWPNRDPPVVCKTVENHCPLTILGKIPSKGLPKMKRGNKNELWKMVRFVFWLPFS